jgi:DNA modification methylase
VSARLELDHGAAAVTDGGDELRRRLDDVRDAPGFPTGTDEAIIEMSAAPAHAACPNPSLRAWVERHRTHDQERPDPGPYAADTQAGKTSLVFKAHGYPTKVPHEAIMRLILHYTRPGDIVLDGFCGTGMTGVAAQMCGAATHKLRVELEHELGDVEWGTRRVVLQDLGPAATFVAAGLNVPVDADAFDTASRELLDRFDRELGWMYETQFDDGRTARIDYTIWSEVRTCPHCGAPVVMLDAAYDPSSQRFRDEFACLACGATLRKPQLPKRRTTVATPLGDRVERIELLPVSIAYRDGARKLLKRFDPRDEAVLRRCRDAAAVLPNVELPYMHMTHERSTIHADGFHRLHHLYSDRALAALSTLWGWIAEHDDRRLRQALRFWVEQGFWGFSWMNRFSPKHFSQVNRNLNGVYYIASAHAEPSVRYGLEGTRPSTGKRATLVKLWSSGYAHADDVRISTGSASRIDIPDDSIDYVFVDPPFGENIFYSDLAFLTEAWHGVCTDPTPEAIIDRNRRRPKGLLDYSELLESCFREFFRVLKPGRWMTVEFSNSSNVVWSAVQQALAAVGFVVADTRVFDKRQHSFRQVTARNAVKRDLIISAYKPHAEVAEQVRIAGATEDSVWAFVREHLGHLPVSDMADGVPRVVRERQADRLYDRMVAFHVAQGTYVPMAAAAFYAGLDRRFPLRDGMYFLPAQAKSYEQLRASGSQLAQTELFVTSESSAIQWLRQLLGNAALPYAEIQPRFFQELQHGAAGWETLPDLKELLDQSFVRDDRGRYLVPDPQRAEHLEQLREAELAKVFESYTSGSRTLGQFRSEAMKVGFRRAYRDRDFATIVRVGRRIPIEAFNEEPALLHYFRNAERLAAQVR